MATRSDTAAGWAIGGMLFAAAMMVMIGIWQIIIGFVAILDDEFFVVAPNYTYEIDTTAWGWIHLIVGVVLVLTGLALFTGSTWARAVGIVLAVLSAIANFLFLPYYPLWAIVLIAANVFIIWALANAGSAQRRMQGLMDSDLPGGYSGGTTAPTSGRPTSATSR